MKTSRNIIALNDHAPNGWIICPIGCDPDAVTADDIVNDGVWCA